MTPEELLLSLTLGTSLILGIGFDLVLRAIQASLDRNKSWIILVPSTPGAHAQILRRKLRKGETDLKIHGSDEKERLIASPKGAYPATYQKKENAKLGNAMPTNRGPLHLIGEATGWNLVAPSKEDRPAGVSEDEYQAMRVCDPKIYWRATRENDMEDFYAAQQNKDPWQKAAIVPALIALVVALGVIGFMVWKFAPGAH